MGITFAGAQDVEAEIPCDAAAGAETEQTREAIKAEQESHSQQEEPQPDESGKEAEATIADQSQEPRSEEQPSRQSSEEKPSQQTTTQPPDKPSSPSDEASEKVRLKRIAAQERWEIACEKKATHIGSLALKAAQAKSSFKKAQEAFNEEVEELQELYDRGYYQFMENDDVGDGEAQGASGEVSDLRDGADSAIHAGGVGDSVHHASGVDQSAASEAAATRWQDRPLVELIAFGAPKSTIENLCELGYETIGRFEALRADIANHREKWPKGIGPGKVTKLENAIVEWGAKNWTADTEAEPAPVVAQDAPPAASVAEATSEPPATVETQPEAASEPAAMPEPAAEVAVKPKRTRKKKEPAAADVQVTEGDAVAAVVSPGPVTPAPSVPAFELDGRYIPTIGQWESADNRDRIAWMQSRMETLRELNAQGMFRPEYPGELVRGKSNGKSGGGIGPAAILQPGPKMDSFLWGFSLSQVQEQPKPASEQARPSALDNDDVDLADL